MPNYMIAWKRRQSVIGGLLASVFLLSSPWAAAETDIVGEASLVIGVANVYSVDGVPRKLVRGMAVRVGERIETEQGGHVHVRFVDGGRLSIRPVSRLQIESYSHSAQAPASSAIKFRLDEGVVRSITGVWGEASRDKFRLNTPVAAIGIKGTDFVVKSDAETTAATVYSGAILLAPLSEACMATVGPCANGFEKLLSQEMKGQMLELSKRQTYPQLVPAVDLLAGGRRSNRPGESEVAVSPSLVPSQADGGPRDSSALPSTTLVSDARVVEVVAQVNSGAPTTPASPPVVNQLVWARYVWVEKSDADTLSQNFSDAYAQGAREAVAGNASNQLYRIPQPSTTSVTLLNTNESKVNFRLANSFASVVRYHDLKQETAKIENAQLQIDFSKASFVTSLDVSSPTIGSERLAAMGLIARDGRFQSSNSNAIFRGAVTLDGAEAGYLFEKGYGAGFLRGITLWGR